MALCMEVGLGPCHIVLDGDLPSKGAQPPAQFLAHVCCGQTAGWIKMPLDREVNVGPGDIVLHGLHGDPASPKGAQPPIFGPCLLWPNGWMDEDATWFGGRPRPRRHCVKWGSSFPRKGHCTPHFTAHVYCGEMAGWIKMLLNTEVDLGPGHIVLDGPSSPQKGAEQPPSLQPLSVVAKRSPISATAELLLYNRKINMNFEE